jgi:hypothetical protein
MVRTFRYLSGDEVERGDQVRYHGQPAKVEFVVSDRTDDPMVDWYVDEYPGGGFMISADGFGRVFLTLDDIDEDLEFIAKATTNHERP